MEKNIIKITEDRLREIVREYIYNEVNERTFYIDENFVSEIHTLITEEYGISKQVEDETTILKDTILNDIRNLQPLATNSNVTTYKHRIMVKCFGVDMLLDYIAYDCASTEDYNKIDKRYFSCAVSPQTKHIILNIAFVNKKPTNEIDKNIQHELTHLFEYIKRGNNSLMSKKYTTLYNTVQQGVQKYIQYQNTSTIEGIYFNIFYALYVSFKCEQDAFFNELDAELKHNSQNWEVVVECSQTYYNLKIIREIIANWKHVNIAIQNLLGITPSMYLKILKNAEKRIVRGIGRVIVKNQKKDISEGYLTTPRIKSKDKT